MFCVEQTRTNICGRCWFKKEEGRELQPYCLKCTSEYMKELRSKSINITIELAEKIIKFAPPDIADKLKALIYKKKSKFVG